MTNQRNLILAVVLTGLLLLGWDAGLRYLYPQPDKPVATATATTTAAAPGTPAKPTREGGLTAAADIALEKQDLTTALASGGRVPIAGPRVIGSINLTGAVLDDLSLTSHTAELAKTSDPVRLFSPAGTPAQHFAQFGWVGAGGNEGIQFPDARTVWRAEGTRLTPQTPVTLRWDNPTGQSFAIRFASTPTT